MFGGVLIGPEYNEEAKRRYKSLSSGDLMRHRTVRSAWNAGRINKGLASPYVPFTIQVSVNGQTMVFAVKTMSFNWKELLDAEVSEKAGMPSVTTTASGAPVHSLTIADVFDMHKTEEFRAVPFSEELAPRAPSPKQPEPMGVRGMVADIRKSVAALVATDPARYADQEEAMQAAMQVYRPEYDSMLALSGVAVYDFMHLLAGVIQASAETAVRTFSRAAVAPEVIYRRVLQFLSDDGFDEMMERRQRKTERRARSFRGGEVRRGHEVRRRKQYEEGPGFRNPEERVLREAAPIEAALFKSVARLLKDSDIVRIVHVTRGETTNRSSAPQKTPLPSNGEEVKIEPGDAIFTLVRAPDPSRENTSARKLLSGAALRRLLTRSGPKDVDVQHPIRVHLDYRIADGKWRNAEAYEVKRGEQEGEAAGPSFFFPVSFGEYALRVYVKHRGAWMLEGERRFRTVSSFSVNHWANKPVDLTTAVTEQQVTDNVRSLHTSSLIAARDGDAEKTVFCFATPMFQTNQHIDYVAEEIEGVKADIVPNSEPFADARKIPAVRMCYTVRDQRANELVKKSGEAMSDDQAWTRYFAMVIKRAMLLSQWFLTNVAIDYMAADADRREEVRQAFRGYLEHLSQPLDKDAYDFMNGTSYNSHFVEPIRSRVTTSDAFQRESSRRFEEAAVARGRDPLLAMRAHEEAVRAASSIGADLSTMMQVRFQAPLGSHMKKHHQKHHRRIDSGISEGFGDSSDWSEATSIEGRMKHRKHRLGAGIAEGFEDLQTEAAFSSSSSSSSSSVGYHMGVPHEDRLEDWMPPEEEEDTTPIVTAPHHSRSPAFRVGDMMEASSEQTESSEDGLEAFPAPPAETDSSDDRVLDVEIDDEDAGAIDHEDAAVSVGGRMGRRKGRRKGRKHHQHHREHHRHRIAERLPEQMAAIKARIDAGEEIPAPIGAMEWCTNEAPLAPGWFATLARKTNASEELQRAWHGVRLLYAGSQDAAPIVVRHLQSKLDAHLIVKDVFSGDAVAVLGAGQLVDLHDKEYGGAEFSPSDYAATNGALVYDDFNHVIIVAHYAVDAPADPAVYCARVLESPGALALAVVMSQFQSQANVHQILDSAERITNADYLRALCWRGALALASPRAPVREEVEAACAALLPLLAPAAAELAATLPMQHALASERHEPHSVDLQLAPMLSEEEIDEAMRRGPLVGTSAGESARARDRASGVAMIACRACGHQTKIYLLSKRGEALGYPSRTEQAARVKRFTAAELGPYDHSSYVLVPEAGDEVPEDLAYMRAHLFGFKTPTTLMPFRGHSVELVSLDGSRRLKASYKMGKTLRGHLKLEGETVYYPLSQLKD